jgi:hypothetical protein
MTGQNKKTTLFRLQWVEWIFVNLPYICFVGLLAVLYISNAHTAEHNLRKIEELKQEVKDAESKYMGIKKKIMYGSTQSQIEKEVQDKGLKVAKKLPKTIDTNKS